MVGIHPNLPVNCIKYKCFILPSFTKIKQAHVFCVIEFVSKKDKGDG